MRNRIFSAISIGHFFKGVLHFFLEKKVLKFEHHNGDKSLAKNRTIQTYRLSKNVIHVKWS